MRKQYKEVISDFRFWDQKGHACDYILYPGNPCEDLSLDETCLGNGESYTILTNKAAHGQKGALAAMIKTVACDTVIPLLKKMSHRKRLKVKAITTDLSSAMMYTAGKVFPKAQLINDRFHVQELLSGTVDQLRIKYRWGRIESGNKALGEYRAFKKNLKKGKGIEPYRPEVLSNGGTLRQAMARSKHIIMKHSSKWAQSQKQRAAILFDKFPRLKEAYNLSMELTSIFNKKKKPDRMRLPPARWYNRVEAFGMNQFNTVLETFTNNYNTILNYFDGRLTNASAEPFNAKIKAFRPQFREVGDIEFFISRLAKLYA